MLHKQFPNSDNESLAALRIIESQIDYTPDALQEFIPNLDYGVKSVLPRFENSCEKFKKAQEAHSHAYDDKTLARRILRKQLCAFVDAFYKRVRADQYSWDQLCMMGPAPHDEKSMYPIECADLAVLAWAERVEAHILDLRLKGVKIHASLEVELLESTYNCFTDSLDWASLSYKKMRKAERVRRINRRDAKRIINSVNSMISYHFRHLNGTGRASRTETFGIDVMLGGKEDAA